MSSTDVWIDDALAAAHNEGLIAREETEGAEDKKESTTKKVRTRKEREKNLKGIN